MLMEAVTLHRRFPYAVLGGLFFLDKQAAEDDTSRRKSTFLNAHSRMRLFTGRDDPAGRDEQYEGMYLLLLDASPTNGAIEAYEVGNPDKEIPFENILDFLVGLVATRNPDFYEFVDGNLVTVTN